MNKHLAAARQPQRIPTQRSDGVKGNERGGDELRTEFQWQKVRQRDVVAPSTSPARQPGAALSAAPPPASAAGAASQPPVACRRKSLCLFQQHQPLNTFASARRPRQRTLAHDTLFIMPALHDWHHRVAPELLLPATLSSDLFQAPKAGCSLCYEVRVEVRLGSGA